MLSSHRDTWGNALFLTSMAALSAGCAGGASGPKPSPTPFFGDGDGGDTDPWTEPLDTTGPEGGSGSGKPADDETGASGWPNEGETGGTGGPPPGDDDGGAPGSGTTGMPPAGDETGDYGGSSTGYDPAPVGDPCPALAQLYSDCNPEYAYETEIEYCNAARASAQSISVLCGTAHAEYLACLSTLSCGVLLQPSVPLGCAFQAAATDLAC